MLLKFFLLLIPFLSKFISKVVFVSLKFNISLTYSAGNISLFCNTKRLSFTRIRFEYFITAGLDWTFRSKILRNEFTYFLLYTVVLLKSSFLWRDYKNTNQVPKKTTIRWNGIICLHIQYGIFNGKFYSNTNRKHNYHKGI